MAQFDIYQNLDPVSSEIIPYLLDIQHQLHQSLATRMVVPLLKQQVPGHGIQKLCPQVSFGGEMFTVSVPEMAGYPVHDLGPKAGSLSEMRDEVLTAVDFLLCGF